jgi:phenylacetate-CoA ligase
MTARASAQPLGGPRDTRIRLAHDLDALSREEIDYLAHRNFLAAVEAATATPAVLDRWPELDRMRHTSELTRLPVMSAADLAEVCPPRSTELLLGGGGPGMVLRSSGTSGRPKVLYHSWTFTAQVNTLGARGVRAALRNQPCSVANCLPTGELNGGALFVHELCKLLPARIFPVGSTLPISELIELISTHRIDTLVGRPRQTADVLLTAGTGSLPSLRSVLYIGEGLSCDDLEAFSRYPSIAVRSLAYSTSETGPVGYQCPHCDPNTHHVHEDAVVVEVLDPDTGDPVDDGVEGEVVLTPLSDTGMALYRYQIGDRGVLLDEGRCECGSVSRRLVLRGRSPSSMTVDGFTVSADLLLSALAPTGVTDPAQCQFEVRWTHSRYQVVLAMTPDAAPRATDSAVLSALRSTYHFRHILDAARCSAIHIRRVPRSSFTTRRGKTPVLVQTWREEEQISS